MAELFYNEIQLELAPGTVIAVTRQVFDLSEWTSTQASFTNSVRVPLSAANIAALGISDELGSASEEEYKLGDIRIRENGTDLIPDSIGFIDSVEGDFANIEVYSGIVDIFELIDKLTLHDLDLSAYDHAWTQANAAASESNTAGYIYAVIQYGANNTGANDYDIRYAHPAFYVHTLVTQIATEQGWTLAGNFLSDSFYLSWVLPFSKNKWEHSDRFLNDQGFTYSLAIDFPFTFATLGATYTDSHEETVVLDPQSVYTAPNSIILNINLNFVVENFSELELNGNTITAKGAIYKNGTTILASTNITADGSYTASVSSASLGANDTIEFAILITTTIADGSVITATSFDITSANLYTDPVSRDILFGEDIYHEDVLHKLNQKQFMKAVAAMAGGWWEADRFTKTLTLRQFKEVYDNLPNALDWSNKLVVTKTGNWYLKKDTSLGYAQVNNLVYDQDETVSIDWGNSQITSSNELLPPERDLVVLPFAASEQVKVMAAAELIGVSIPFWQSDGAGGFEPTGNSLKQRIGYIYRAGTGSATYTDGTNTTAVADPPIVKFIEPASANNLGWNNSLKAANWSEFQGMIDKPVRITIKLNLTTADIHILDHMIPIYLDRARAYFYVNKVSEFVEGESTEVELIKL